MTEPVRSAAADRGPLTMAAAGLGKDYKLGHGAVLHAVRDVSFGLYKSAVVALVGESGSGKTTVARLLAGQERQTTGTVTLDGKPVDVRSRHAFRRYKSSVQLVFQDPFASLNPVHTVGYHLARPVKLHQGPRVDVHKQVMALLEQVRLTPAAQFLPKFPHELSGGQRQRVSFARALAARPTVLLADEPVSMLDVSIRLEMLNLLDDLCKRLALAMLYITHDIASARYFADEILVMYAGQIVERGPAEEITQQPAHPYTQLLVASAPDPDNLGSLLRSSNIAPGGRPPGTPPRTGGSSPPVSPSGCPFATRCPLADDKCRRENPALLQITPVRAAACWRLPVAAPALAGGPVSPPTALPPSPQHPRGNRMLTTRSFTSRRVLAVAAAGLLAAGLGACSSSNPSSSSSSSGSSSTSGSSQTLVMESSPETTITQDFNPFVSTAAPQGMCATGLIYEPLIQFDLASPAINYPWLATSYSWGDGGKSITFTIRQGVKWNNGTAMTPADVVFTYEELKKFPAINLSGLTINSVTSSGNTVTVTFPTSQYMNLQNVAGVAILPKAVWSTVGNPATYTDANPVGTGPYMLSNFTSEGFTLTKNPDYWKPVPVSKVYFPVYTSNTGALTALFSGQITWTGNYIPGLQKNFVDTAPAYHHFWEAAGGTNSIMPNLTKWPTNQLPVRQAISEAIDRTLIASEGEAGLESPVLNSTGLTLPTFAAWSGPVASMTNSATADAAAAKATLEKAGYKLDSAGFFALNGKEVAMTLIDPSAYTDYAQDDALIAQQLRAAGINVTFQGLSVNAWNADVADGDFQLTSHWSNGGITPYNMYEGWLDSSLASGSSATGDYERLNDPTMNADLAKVSGDSTVSAQAADLAPIETYVAQNLPVIPTTTAADWFEYNSQHFTGWPTQQNPYDSGQPSGTNNGPGTGSDEVVILHLTPR